MSRKISLLDRAWLDIEQVQSNLYRSLDDEIFLDAAAYHLQQCVEKMIKYVINASGRQFSQTHNILELCQQMDSYSISYPDWIYRESSVLISYYESTEYSENLIGNKNKIEELLDLAREWYDEIKQGVIATKASVQCSYLLADMETKLKVALQMLDNGQPWDNITKVTGLTRDDLNID